MILTAPFVLPGGTIFVAVSDLPQELQQKVGAEPGDFAVSRANSRTLSKILNSEAAGLMRQFEKPRTIAQAVARYSRDQKKNPERLLEDAFPMLESMIASGLLVSADSEQSNEVKPSLTAEERVDNWTVLGCIQTLEDTEVYQVRGKNGEMAALKIARDGCASKTTPLFDNEVAILTSLDGAVTPRFLSRCDWNGRPYIAVEWCPGFDAQSAFQNLRSAQGSHSRPELLRFCEAILGAYAHLHKQGVIHGDVHPRNVLIEPAGSVKLIDFGLARRESTSSGQAPMHRGGVGFFFEPEFARALLEGRQPPNSSIRGEQFAVAAMLYVFLTGSNYAEFSLERGGMLRQIAEEKARSFSSIGVEPWHEVEAILQRALLKNPEERFPTMNEMLSEWRKLRVPARNSQMASEKLSLLEKMPDRLIERLGLSGPLLNGARLSPPSVSVNFGAAGIAYAIYRLAGARDDGELLALAELWIRKSLRELHDSGAFYNKELDITKDTVGTTSLFHSAAGVHAVRGLIAAAQGDTLKHAGAVEDFIAASSLETSKLDLTLGKAGTLLGCSFLLQAANLRPKSAYADHPGTANLREFGNTLLQQLWRILDGYGVIRESRELSNLGIAHGWAGVLYATLCWAASAREPLPKNLPERLEQLAACAEALGKGLRWKWDLAMPQSAGSGWMPGWCNGSAGHVMLWAQAYGQIQDPRFLAWAEGAGWTAWETPSPVANLCCGFAGQAYAMLCLYRLTRDGCWLERARELTNRAGPMVLSTRVKSAFEELALRPESLYKGELGVSVLAADLIRPDHSSMPLFELEC